MFGDVWSGAESLNATAQVNPAAAMILFWAAATTLVLASVPMVVRAVVESDVVTVVLVPASRSGAFGSMSTWRITKTSLSRGDSGN